MQDNHLLFRFLGIVLILFFCDMQDERKSKLAIFKGFLYNYPINFATGEGSRMNFPQFIVSRFGFYDSEVTKLGKREGKYRSVLGYELDFFPEDCQGGQALDGTFYPAKQGCVMLSKPGQKRAMHSPYRSWFLNIVTQDQELQELFDQMPTMSTLWEMDEAVKLFQQMQSIEDKTSLEGRLRMHGYVCQLLGLLTRLSTVPDAARANAVRHQKTLMTVDKYIREHLSEDLSLAVLARVANLDPTYFHKLFTSVYGMTPARRVLGYRISAAKNGIIEGTMPLDELAAKCGFSSQTYFCYKFKRMVGSSPTRYREIYLSRLKK